MAKILIVDDSRTSRRMLKNILENSGQEKRQTARKVLNSILSYNPTS